MDGAMRNMLNNLSDDDLLLRYREGDADAFGTLFERYRGLVFHFARLMLNDTHRAEDILQETFLSVIRAADRYEPRGHFRTWILRMARNRCLNWIESERVRRTNLAYVDRAVTEAHSPEIPEALEIVKRAIQGLPERQREAIVLYAFDSMGYQEIARVLDIPANTVKTLIHRGRATLARALEAAEKESS